MADSLSTIGSISNYLAISFNNLPTGVSGVLPQLVDLSRQHVANFAGVNIGSNAIADIYQPSILDFAKADILDLISAQGGMSLGELTFETNSIGLSATQFRMLGEMKLKALGRHVQAVRSLS